VDSIGQWVADVSYPHAILQSMISESGSDARPGAMRQFGDCGVRRGVARVGNGAWHRFAGTSEGVVIQDAVARLGPGYAYDQAFKQPLHRATEFTWLETRQGWVHVQLPDASEGWLRQTECMQVQ
jgi:hypothetical protein